MVSSNDPIRVLTSGLRRHAIQRLVAELSVSRVWVHLSRGHGVSLLLEAGGVVCGVDRITYHEFLVAAVGMTDPNDHIFVLPVGGGAPLATRFVPIRHRSSQLWVCGDRLKRGGGWCTLKEHTISTYSGYLLDTRNCSACPVRLGETWPHVIVPIIGTLCMYIY